MSLRKRLKKAARQMGRALKNPKNLINPLYSAYSLEKNIENDHKQGENESDARTAAVLKAEADAAEQEFQNDLEKNRRTSGRSNVIYAGILGNSDKIGLGGQKNLLGL